MLTFRNWLEQEELGEGKLAQWGGRLALGAASLFPSLGHASEPDQDISGQVPVSVWKQGKTQDERDKIGNNFINSKIQQPERYNQIGQFSNKSFTINKEEHSIKYEDGVKLIRHDEKEMWLYQPPRVNLTDNEIDERIKDKLSLGGKGYVTWKKIPPPVEKGGRTYERIFINTDPQNPYRYQSQSNPREL